MTLIEVALTLAAAVSMCIVGHIAGSQLGTFIGKLYVCVVGFEIEFIDKAGNSTVMNFRGWDAWTAQNDIELLKRKGALE